MGVEYSQQEKNNLAAKLESIRASVGLFISPYSSTAQEQFNAVRGRPLWFTSDDMKALREAADALRAGSTAAGQKEGSW